ncbi:acetylserotonin O-methyltransferase-like [Pogona vitticeps]
MSVTEDTETIRTLFRQQHGFLMSKIMFTACELGVFDLLLESGEPLSSGAIAERLGTSPSGTERLLEACVSLKLLRMERKDSEGLYGNTNLANLYLAKSSPKTQYHYLKFYSEVTYPGLQFLTDIVREGKGLFKKTHGMLPNSCFAALYRSEEELQRFSDAMNDAWNLYGREVMSAFNLSQFPLIYDLGGGSGTLAKECVSLYPNSMVTIFDLPKVVERAKKQPMSSDKGQITFQEGDFFKDPVPEADLYILARILHDWEDEKCVQLLTKLHQACRPGGGVLVIEMLLNEDRCGPFEAHLHSMLMLVLTEGKDRTPSEYKALFTAAGFKEIQHKKGSCYSIVLGRKQ